MEIKCPKCANILSISSYKTCYTEESLAEGYYRTLKRISTYCGNCDLDWGFHLIGEGNPTKPIKCEDTKSG